MPGAGIVSITIKKDEDVLIYRISRLLLLTLIRLVFRWRVEGSENIPRQGPVILCANHRSYWDPPVMGSAATRQVHFMAKEELLRVPLLGGWMRAVGVVSLKRGSGDLGSLRRALDLLKEGKVIGIFPEGTRSRSGELLPAHPGVAYLAMMAGAPVVPMAICGDYRPFSTVRVRIGRPLDFASYRKRGKPSAAELGDLANRVIMSGIRELLSGPDGEKDAWR